MVKWYSCGLCPKAWQVRRFATRRCLWAALILWWVTPASQALSQDTLEGDGTECQRITRLDADTTRYHLGASGDFLYTRPTLLGFLPAAAGDVLTYTQETFRRENTLPILGMAALTGALVLVDQRLLDEVQRWGDHVGVEPEEDNTRGFFSVFGYDLRFPTDAGSAMYFLGDGWTHLAVGTSILGYGYVSDDLRALRTGSQVFEAVIAAGFVTQVLKHVTGRESPIAATAEGGKWRWFPNQIDYHQNIPAYDAFPSGHLATAMATVTVLAENYPDVTAIRPVGYTLMTLLGLQMMNNGVHWASDYPLALAIGYSLGKTAVASGREADPNPGSTGAARRVELLHGWRLTVTASSSGTPLVGMARAL